MNVQNLYFRKGRCTQNGNNRRMFKKKVNSENRMRAVASVTFDNEFAVHDIKVIESQNGLFIAMPSRKLQTENSKI